MTKATTAHKHGALGPNRASTITNDPDDRLAVVRERRVAPRAEPSTQGAKQRTGGRRQKRKGS